MADMVDRAEATRAPWAGTAWGRNLATPPETPYPPAPWRARAAFWVGVFRVGAATRLPVGLRPALGARTRVVMLARYLPGSTLVYDELIIATPVLLGARPGLAVESIWVDSVASLWGGRRIWGLPKELAEFTWDGAGVRVSDSAGEIVSLALGRPGRARLPSLPLVAPSIGRMGAAWTYALFPLRARLGRAEMRTRGSAPRLGLPAGSQAWLSLATQDCQVTFPAARLIAAQV